jgi:TRAP-type mannitol/chloroaromatic compound transport system permease small subunit
MRRLTVEKLKAFVNALDTISEWSGRIFGWTLMILMGLAVFEVITRRFFNHPTIWNFDLQGYIFAASVLFLMGYTLLYKAHANVDLLYERLSPRIQAILDLITYTVLLLFFVIVFLISGIRFAATSWSMMERTATAWNFYVFPAKTLLPVGAFLLLIQVVSEYIKKIVFLSKGVRL